MDTHELEEINSTLFKLVIENNINAIQDLLKNNSFNINYFRDNEHRSLLMVASQEGHLAMVKVLIENGSTIDDTIEDDNFKSQYLDYSPLTFAVVGEHIKIVKELIIKSNFCDWKSLKYALSSKNKDVIEVLLYLGMQYFEHDEEFNEKFILDELRKNSYLVALFKTPLNQRWVYGRACSLSDTKLMSLFKEEKKIKSNPEKLVEILTNFTTAKSNLKHTAHNWDMSQREGKWKDINSFLEDIKEDWKAIDNDLKNTSPNLHSTIESFLFNQKLGEKNPESKQECIYSWGEHHLKIGWSSPEFIKWCNENPKESPFNYMLEKSKRKVIEGMAVDRFSDVINVFKNEIEIRSDKNQLKKIFRNFKKTLKNDFILSIDVSLEGVEFYTDVELFKESLLLIFKMMQERESSPEIKVWAKKFIDKGYIELTIRQIASSTRKEPQEIINKIQKDDGGDMGKILSKLSSLCDWRIEYPFDEKKRYSINLLDSKTNQITFKKANNIEGFTHILRFYK